MSAISSVGLVYRHYKGGYYRLLEDDVWNCADGLAEPVRHVRYVGQDGRKWTRPFDEFFSHRYLMVWGADWDALVKEKA